VVLGAASGAERTVKTAQLFDQAFAQWGSSEGQSLTALASSGHDSAPNMRDEICRRGRSGIVLSDDAENDGAIFQQDVSTQMSDSSNPVYALYRSGEPSAPAGRSVGARSATGRPVLGPRADFEPLTVYLGRAPGSTAVAMGPRSTERATATAAAIPASTAAFAPLPGFGANAAPPIRTFGPAPVRAANPAQPAPIPAVGQPLQLHGAITSGVAPSDRSKVGAIQPAKVGGAKAKAQVPDTRARAVRVQPAKAQPSKARAAKARAAAIAPGIPSADGAAAATR
jgi:D-alanyl-D-alanine carboxypeptidase